jgi:hypothetical protein
MYPSFWISFQEFVYSKSVLMKRKASQANGFQESDMSESLALEVSPTAQANDL